MLDLATPGAERGGGSGPGGREADFGRMLGADGGTPQAGSWWGMGSGGGVIPECDELEDAIGLGVEGCDGRVEVEGCVGGGVEVGAVAELDARVVALGCMCDSGSWEAGTETGFGVGGLDRDVLDKHYVLPVGVGSG
ncbi:hypothetical protein L1887_47184 [Cichorium endivia]|nr:hypothetical protein L1887_47184 [Cichorium endivia]